MKNEFEIWMMQEQGKSRKAVYQYALSVDRISKHYSEQTDEYIDIFRVANVPILREIEEKYQIDGEYAEFGGCNGGLIRDAMATYIEFLEFNIPSDECEVIDQEDDDSEEPDKDPSVKKEPVKKAAKVAAPDHTDLDSKQDLEKSLISQVDTLFPGYQIFGKNKEGIGYEIGGQTIDMLLVNTKDKSLLALELNAGKADFTDFGQISMYIGLLSRRFSDTPIKGMIIAEEVDDSLRNACLITDKIGLKTYKMQLYLKDMN